jgi:Predicted metal-binding protein (DUF2103)
MMSVDWSQLTLAVCDFVFHLGIRYEPSIMSSNQSDNSATPGRLVWNHSTHLPGLIPILKQLTQVDGITTITPAVIGRTKSHIPNFKIKISAEIRGGYKLIARKGKMFQEVFVLTELSQEDLLAAIAPLMD